MKLVIVGVAGIVVSRIHVNTVFCDTFVATSRWVILKAYEPSTFLVILVNANEPEVQFVLAE